MDEKINLTDADLDVLLEISLVLEDDKLTEIVCRELYNYSMSEIYEKFKTCVYSILSDRIKKKGKSELLDPVIIMYKTKYKLTNYEIARRLDISEGTVRKVLKEKVISVNA